MSHSQSSLTPSSRSPSPTSPSDPLPPPPPPASNFLYGSDEQKAAFDASTLSVLGCLCIMTSQTSFIMDPSPGQFPPWLSGFSRHVTFFLHRYLIRERAHPRHVQGRKVRPPPPSRAPCDRPLGPMAWFPRDKEIQEWRKGLSSTGTVLTQLPRVPREGH